MNYEMKTQKLLDAVVATGAGVPAALPPGKKIFSITGTFVGTVKIQGSVGGSVWKDLYTSTVEADVEIDDVYPKHRGNVTAYTSGAITVTSGHPVAK